jgi:MFS family permease
MGQDPAPDSCPLSAPAQTRNLALYALNTGLIYLASPLLYVGTVQAPLCKRLGASDAVANLPSTAQLLAAVVPILVAWYFPYVRVLRRIVVVSFALAAAMCAVVAAALLLPSPNWLRIAVVIAQGAVTGGAVFTAVALMWEVLGRGVAASRRGLTLALAFGGGPVLAALAALDSQLLLAGKLGPLTLPGLDYPRNFIAVFASGIPVLVAAAFLSNLFVVPPPVQEVQRQPFLQGVFGGLGDFLGNQVLLLATLVAILVYAGNQINSNMTLAAQVALGEDPEKSAGYQLALRFSMKCVVGIFLGWLLTKSNPKAGVLATAALALTAVLWALTVSGPWFLVSFGLFGAGELFGVYLPNYILCCSAPAKMRRNLSFATMTLVPAAPAGALFGAISDYFRAAYSPTMAFRLSFAAAFLFVGSGTVLALFLPAHPRPEDH